MHPAVANNNHGRARLYPPLDHDHDDEEDHNDNGSSSNNRKSFMPAKLKANFTELKRLKENSNNSNKRNRSDGNTDDDNSTITKEEEEEDDVCPRRQRLAEETAVMAAQEVQRMRNSIAELEALVNNNSVIPQGNNLPRFSSLPHIVHVHRDDPITENNTTTAQSAAATDRHNNTGR
jgi:hypothetical protein